MTAQHATAIEIVDYDPAWPMIFESLAAQLRSALGQAALAVTHIGSTSVPGLAAKPVIDIHLTVADSAQEPAYAPPILALGYTLVHREPEWFEHRMFKHRTPDVNLHVFSEGCPELARCLMFRDWLRSNAADRTLYAQTKRDLAAHDWASVQDYAGAKDAVVAEIMARAERGAI